MRIYSQKQARWKFAHPEKFDRRKIAAEIRKRGGLHKLPFRKSGEIRNIKRINTDSRRRISRNILKRRQRK
jgi:hypothetical protein